MWANSPPANPCESRREHEGNHLRPSSIDAHNLGSDLVLANGNNSLAVGGGDKPFDEQNGQKNKDPRPDHHPGDIRHLFHPIDHPAHPHEAPGSSDGLDVFNGAT